MAGATGRLGGPLADSLIDRGHRVRALTRDPGSAAADRLSRRGADIVVGDLDDPPSLRQAAAGTDVVFVLSTPHHGTGPAAEARQAISLADAAVAARAGYLVYASAAGARQAHGVPMLDGSGTARAARRTMSSRGDAPVGASLEALLIFGDGRRDGPGANIGSRREGLVTTDDRPASDGCGPPRRVCHRAAQQRARRTQ